MTDKRLFKSNGRVAHVSLKGEVEVERFVEGERQRVVARSVDLRSGLHDQARERELWLGEEFVVLDRQAVEPGGALHAFGFCARDGAVGWVHDSVLDDPREPTHRVKVARSYAKSSPDLKTADDLLYLTFGAPLAVVETKGDWLRFDIRGMPSWVPRQHVEPVGVLHDDPAAIAALFIGTPYLWGGNSAYGIDCSGLVQAGWLACGRACPPDSDLQEDMPGSRVTRSEAARGDLIFWKGHVALVEDEATIIHANAHAMSTLREGLDAAIARNGPPTSILRWSA